MLIDKYLVLKVNRKWRPIAVETVRDAFKNLSKGTHHALHIDYLEDENGKPDYNEVVNMRFVDFATWLDLQGRQCDRWVHTGKNVKAGNSRIRVPAVVMALNCEKEFIKEPVFSFDTLWLRDGGKCQYTFKELKKEECSIDHIIPRSKSGDTNWLNCVVCSKEVNTKKGDTDPKEFCKKYGYKVPEPKVPSPIVVACSIRNKHEIPDWRYFL